MLCEMREVSKNFGEKNIIQNVNLTLEAGSIYALLGENGSGKSTLMKMIVGLVKADGGKVTYKGQDIGVSSKKEVAYMPTETYFYSYMKVKDVGRYYQDFFEDFNLVRFIELQKKMELNDFDPIRALSSGQIAKLKLATTLARDAKLYLLDEPLSGIDLLSRDVIIRTILEVSKEDNTIVIASHLIEEIEQIVDRVIFLNKGSIKLTGDMEEIRALHGMSMADTYRKVMV